MRWVCVDRWVLHRHPPDLHDLSHTVLTRMTSPLAAHRHGRRPFIGLLLTHRVEAEQGCLRRIKIKPPSFLFHCVFSGVAHMGDILGGAYRRSFVAGYNFEFTALYAAAYRRSIVAVYIAEFSSLGTRSWAAIGIVFNSFPAGTQLLPISDPPRAAMFCAGYGVSAAPCFSRVGGGRSLVH
jgi:hypothetical protein